MCLHCSLRGVPFNSQLQPVVTGAVIKGLTCTRYMNVYNDVPVISGGCALLFAFPAGTLCCLRFLLELPFRIFDRPCGLRCCCRSTGGLAASILPTAVVGHINMIVTPVAIFSAYTIHDPYPLHSAAPTSMWERETGWSPKDNGVCTGPLMVYPIVLCIHVP